MAMISPGADSLERMGILRSWKFSSWLRRWARWREQPWASWKSKAHQWASTPRPTESCDPPPPGATSQFVFSP